MLFLWIPLGADTEIPGLRNVAKTTRQFNVAGTDLTAVIRVGQLPSNNWKADITLQIPGGQSVDATSPAAPAADAKAARLSAATWAHNTVLNWINEFSSETGI